jgi:hypothetical protein
VHSVTQEEGRTGSMLPRTSRDLSHINRSQLVPRVPRLHTNKCSKVFHEGCYRLIRAVALAIVTCL